MALTALTLAGCGGSAAAQSAGGQSPAAGAASGSAVGSRLFHPPARPPVALAGTSLTGTPLSVAALRGRVVVVNFWQSTCGPCKAEAPALDAVAAADAGRVAFLGVDVTEPPSAGLAYQRAERVPYPSVQDRQGKMLAAFSRFVYPTGTPDTLVFTPTGQIAASVIGGVTRPELARLIRAAA